MATEKKQTQSSPQEKVTNIEEAKKSNLQIQQLLKAMVDNSASDLHITVDSPPRYENSWRNC